MSALARSVGITIEDKAALEPGFDDIAKRMVHDPIAEGGGADFALLRIVNVKMLIRTGLVTAALQLLLQLKQMVRQLMLKAGGADSSTFATRGLAVGVE